MAHERLRTVPKDHGKRQTGAKLDMLTIGYEWARKIQSAGLREASLLLRTSHDG